MGEGGRDEMLRIAPAAIFAFFPLVAGVVALASLRPPPARSGPGRELVVAPGDDAARVARAFPGRAAIPIEAFEDLAFDQLPFDQVILAAGVTVELTHQGFSPGGEDLAGSRFIRPHRWTILDHWARWELTVDHGTGPGQCDRRFNSGYGCGRGLRFIPDLSVVAGQLRGAVRVTAAKPSSSVELVAPGAPSEIVGWVAALQGPVTLFVRRGDIEARTDCDQYCPLTIPEGTGAVVVRITGPNPPLAFNLYEATAP